LIFLGIENTPLIISSCQSLRCRLCAQTRHSDPIIAKGTGIKQLGLRTRGG